MRTQQHANDEGKKTKKTKISVEIISIAIRDSKVKCKMPAAHFLIVIDICRSISDKKQLNCRGIEL